MPTPINNCLLKLSRRAENSARQDLIKTFVDVDPLFTLLSSTDHQVFYGRRGTGKTHALTYLENDRKGHKDIVAYVDLRNIGSSGGIYADSSRPITERATCLLKDTISAVHDEILSAILNDDESYNLATAGPALDLIAESIQEVRVQGTTVRYEGEKSTEANQDTAGINLEISKSPKLNVDGMFSKQGGTEKEKRTSREGLEEHYVNFGSVGSSFRKLTQQLAPYRIWILLDEWSSLPAILQPYLADLLRRSIFPITGITVKIAAIEHRSKFQIKKSDGEYIGIELGADAAADVNLDDFMVFDNDANRAKQFFQNLLARHVRSSALGKDYEDEIPKKPDELLQSTFKQERSFEEFVRASEGVPRDAINILALAAQKALNDSISIDQVRAAARNWYQRDKDSSVSSDPRSHQLLHWVIDEVIGQRKARAFLLRSNTKHPLIENLYDSRVLHILKRNISSKEEAGVRYDVYKLDYGCYVDLINTQKNPEGLLPYDGEDGEHFIEVPPDDYRSIRRAILNLDEFESAHPDSASLDRE